MKADVRLRALRRSRHRAFTVPGIVHPAWTSESGALPSRPAGDDAPSVSHGVPVLPVGYTLVRSLGRGAFCDAWLVADAAGGRHLLKQLAADQLDHGAARDALAREGTLLQTLDSPYFPRLTGLALDRTPPQIIIQWIEGISLAERLQPGAARKAVPVDGSPDRHPLAPRDAVWIARQIAQGLASLIASGWVHGDVKPANVIVQPDFAIKLIDLGLARPVRGGPSCGKGYLSGTPEYLAPELLSGGECSAERAELYSLGATLFEMLAGTPPFPGDTAEQVLRRQCGSHAPDLRGLVPRIDGRLADLVAALLHKQPLRRPSSMREVVDRLVALELGVLTTVAAPPFRERVLVA